MRILESASMSGQMLTAEQTNTLQQLQHSFQLMQQHMKLVHYACDVMFITCCLQVQRQKTENDTKPQANNDLAHLSADDLADVFGTWVCDVECVT